MSQSQLSSDSQVSEQSDNERPFGSYSTAIACRVCNSVFLDNVSLVLHFECHVEDGFRLCGRDLESLRGQHFSSNSAPCSYPSPVPSVTTQNHKPSDSNLPHIPVLNASKPAMSPYGATPSSTSPLMYSQLGARNSASGPAAAPQLRGENGGRSCFLAQKNQEIIAITDDEEDEDKGTAEVDLTLKL